MAVVPSPSFSLSNFFSSIIPNETQFQFPYTRKTHISFPLSTLSISLRTLSKPNFGSLINLMGTYNVQVVVEDNEPEDRILNRFRREVMKAGVIRECKRRMYFETKQDQRKRKSREAAKKNSRRRPRFRSSQPDIKETTNKKKETYEFDDDNWDLPEGDLPF